MDADADIHVLSSSTDEDDDAGAMAAPVPVTPGPYQRRPGKPMCAYGLSCYRHNPAHWEEYDHPTGHRFISGSSNKRPHEQAVSGGKGSGVAAVQSPLAFQLDRLHPSFVGAGLVPPEANESTFRLRDALNAPALAGATEVHLVNYMIDLDLIVRECPAIARVPCVWVIHGDSVPPKSHAALSDPARFRCLRPPCERYGTHHSKAIFIVRPERLTVHVFTANFIFTDLHNKTNGTWSADFPRREPLPPPSTPDSPPDGFGADLDRYMRALKGLGERPPPGWEPRDQSTVWATYSVDWVRRYDYSASPGRLVGSIPGRHTGEALRQWGHLFVRARLDEERLLRPHEAFGASEPIVLQFSSLSSPGTNATWMSELKRSFGGQPGAMPPLEIVFPTVAQVRDALEGWVAGSSIPCDAINAKRLRERLRELSPAGALCVWDGGDGAYGGASGRGFAVPHMKSYCRYRPSDRKLAWAILASHNLSQAAWGKCERNGAQLYIKSYELGVLLLPSLLGASGATDSSAGASAAASADSAAASSSSSSSPSPAPSLYAPPRAGDPPLPSGAVVVPLPYSLPPTPYAATDEPWSTSNGQDAPAWAHVAGADRHGRSIGQAHGGFYGPDCWGRTVTLSLASPNRRVRARTDEQL